MQEKINQFHLYKDDYSKLHFQIKDIKSHLAKHPQHVFKAHRHSYFQFIWFKNAGKHFVDYELIDHPANCLFMLNEGQVHYFDRDSDNDGVLYHFDVVFLHGGRDTYRQKIEFQLFSEVGSPYIKLNKPSIELFEFVTKRLWMELDQVQYNYKEIIFGLVQNLVLAAERLKHNYNEAIHKSSNDQEIALKFKKEVDAAIDHFFTVEAYAKKLGISSRKLSAISKSYLQSSPSQFISKRKILEAKRLLSNVDISIKEVAFRLGFDQATYFTKYFKKNTGITPKEFLAQLP